MLSVGVELTNSVVASPKQNTVKGFYIYTRVHEHALCNPTAFVDNKRAA